MQLIQQHLSIDLFYQSVRLCQTCFSLSLSFLFLSLSLSRYIYVYIYIYYDKKTIDVRPTKPTLDDKPEPRKVSGTKHHYQLPKAYQRYIVVMTDEYATSSYNIYA